MDVRQKRNKALGERVVKALESRNMEAYYASTKEEAVKKALELIPKGSSINMGAVSYTHLDVYKRQTLGIDIGTTTISIILSDTDDRHCSKALTVQNKSRIRTQYRWEKVQDVTGIIDCAVEAADGYLRRFPDIKAIGLTGQMHGILYLNREGKCISPLYTCLLYTSYSESDRRDLLSDCRGEGGIVQMCYQCRC